MERKEFMRRLEALLSDLPENERAEALQYYNDYLDDAGVENEAAVLEELGSPDGLAESIRQGLKEDGGESGGFFGNRLSGTRAPPGKLKGALPRRQKIKNVGGNDRAHCDFVYFCSACRDPGGNFPFGGRFCADADGCDPSGRDVFGGRCVRRRRDLRADRLYCGRGSVSGGSGAGRGDEPCDDRAWRFVRPAFWLADRKGVSESLPGRGKCVQQAAAQKGGWKG